jgi:hypothetical protein
VRLPPVLAVLGLLSLACQDVKTVAYEARDAAQAAKKAAMTPSMPCDARVSEVEPIDCLSGTLSCGQVIEGTTSGGDSRFDDDFYSRHFCFPAGDDHGGPERVYLLEAQPYSSVTLSLQSDCVDLDIAAAAFAYDGTCPTASHPVPECEGNNRRGGGSIVLQTFNNPRTYVVAIDGKGRGAGTFRLSVDCKEIRTRE